jgi:hypothetical protein
LKKSSWSSHGARPQKIPAQSSISSWTTITLVELELELLVVELELELELELVELESTWDLTNNEPSTPCDKALLGRACALTLVFALALAFGRVCSSLCSRSLSKNSASAAGASANCCNMPSFHRRGGITKTETAYVLSNASKRF